MTYTMFGWFDIDRWEEADDEDLSIDVPWGDIQAKIDSIEWPSNTHIDFHPTNFSHHLVMHSQHNHTYGVPDDIDELISWLGEQFPGTHGLIYEQDDEDPTGAFDNAYRVRVMIRGQLTQHVDPYFSPLTLIVGT